MADRIGQRFGDYHLLRFLGEGTFGDVYLGQHIYKNTPAAVKVFKTTLTPDKFKDFLTEVRTVLLRHPNIVPILDFGIGEGDIPFLVMEYAPNGTLLQHHPKGVPLPLPHIVIYVKQLAAALQYAHDERRIHRDVKPENMLFGANNQLLLSDFGIAVVAHTPSSQSAEDAIGTARYMAPEQWQGKPVPASDQYAVGVIVYEWLGGESPFAGGTLQLMYQHLHVPPPPFKKDSNIPPQVEQVVMTALAKDPQHRFPTVQAFAIALEQASQAVQAMQAPAAPKPVAGGYRPASMPPKGDDLRAVLAISAVEAQTGTTRTLTLPRGRKVQVSMPAGIADGHVLRLEGQGEAVAVGGQAGALILTINVTHKQAPIRIADALATEYTAHAASTVVSETQTPTVSATESQAPRSNVYQPQVVTPASQAAQSPGTVVPPHQPPVADGSLDNLPSAQRGISRRTVVLGLAGLVVVGVAGGAIALLTHTPPPQNPTPTVAAPTQNSTPTVAAPNPAITSSGAMFGYDLAHTHFNPAEHILSPTNVSRLVPLWSTPTGNSIQSSPAVANGVLYVGSDDHKLYAFEASTGKPLWSTPTEGPIGSSSPAVANGVVYVGSNDKKLYAFNATMGKPLWNVATGNLIDSSPAVANGVVYIGSNDGKLYAFVAGTGKPLWSTPTGNAITSSPAVANGVLYVSSNDKKLYAFEASTGKPLWSATTGDSIQSSPAVANGIVYVGSLDQNLYAFEASTGKPLWSAPTGGVIGSSSPAVANGVVYIGSNDHKLYAFNATTGKPLWNATTGKEIYASSPAVANGVVYIGSFDTKLYAFEASKGKPLWSAATGDFITSSPAVANGVLYVGSNDTKLYAFHLP